jgi:CBS domain-containing protein
MRAIDILRAKGGATVTIPPGADVRTLLDLRAEHRIGAVVLSPDGSTIAGIVSERDVVRALAATGAGVLDEPVSTICSPEVHTVGLGVHIDALMRLMTDQRIRHIPVVADGVLQGIVSIGDVVKHRIVELETEREALSDYISTSG